MPILSRDEGRNRVTKVENEEGVFPNDLAGDIEATEKAQAEKAGTTLPSLFWYKLVGFVTNATNVTVAPNTPERRRSILSFLSSNSMVVVAWCKKAGLLQMQRILHLQQMHQKEDKVPSLLKTRKGRYSVQAAPNATNTAESSGLF